MPVAKIERIVGGVVQGRVERGSIGFFACHEFGSNVNAIPLASLDDVADFLRLHPPRSSTRMNPTMEAHHQEHLHRRRTVALTLARTDIDVPWQ